MIFRMVKKIWTDLSSVLSQCRCLTDRQTDGAFSWLAALHSMQRCKYGQFLAHSVVSNVFSLLAIDISIYVKVVSIHW